MNDMLLGWYGGTRYFFDADSELFFCQDFLCRLSFLLVSACEKGSKNNMIYMFFVKSGKSCSLGLFFVL
jgi:hypothetical protein